MDSNRIPPEWELIKFLERPRAIRLLLVLKENTPHKKYTLTQILAMVGGSPETLMKRIRELQSLGLITKVITNDNSRVSYRLTSRGIEVAKKLEEAVGLLGEGFGNADQSGGVDQSGYR
ncbi:winged helix-turn-helix transcriptional regulator [Thermococcus sp.]|uniref:winged helix-turn-helix transcriptional regulator n=1 Tax=Thermococcus sp. TaxID=35749 RepID=UPI002608F17D|nr:winged helix-turn-helix transcriptional regulator [Thermococcus sp.]